MPTIQWQGTPLQGTNRKTEERDRGWDYFAVTITCSHHRERNHGDFPGSGPLNILHPCLQYQQETPTLESIL